MKNNIQKITAHIVDLITHECITLIPVYASDTDNFSNQKDETIRKEILLQMMQDNRALWV